MGQFTRQRTRSAGSSGGHRAVVARPLRRMVAIAAVVIVAMQAMGAGMTGPAAALAVGNGGQTDPVLVGRAVLPVETYAPGPPAGTFFGTTVTNGVAFPLPSQPVEGFSAIIDGRRDGEVLAMPDNGFGSKASSFDFLIRAYYLTPEFATATGGTGSISVGEHISFRDPLAKIGFPIVNEGSVERLLTGGDIDPESLQRDGRGDLWVGDEFGPWILHFDSAGVLLDPPFAVPGLMSPNNPFLAGAPATHPNSRGFEAIAISRDGQRLYAALEGATVAEAGTTTRHIYEFDIRDERLTGRTWTYNTEAAGYMIADMDVLDDHTVVVIERDAGLGVTATFRNVYAFRLDQHPDEPVDKRLLVDLAHIADPDLVSLPPLHAGDVGLGDPFSVVCESVEALHVLRHGQLMIGCDNNFPNTGRNPGRADDNEIIVVDLDGRHRRLD